MINKLIRETLKDFSVDGVKIPVSFMFYNGHENTYITYQRISESDSYSGDDDILGVVVRYDFDVYSKGDYTNIIKELKNRLKAGGFTYQPAMSSSDMYENDTGFYHRTLCFGILKGENING